MARRDDSEELTVGLRAGLAVFARRPADLLRVAHSADVAGEIHELRAFCRREHVPLREMRDAELEDFGDSNHHEGLVVGAKPRPWIAPHVLADALLESRGVAIALDRVRNPYNVGAILRTAAFLGVDAALFGPTSPQPALPATAIRVAEGGVEHLSLSRSTELAGTLTKLRGRGIQVIGADGGADSNAIGFRFRRPTVLVVGHEREGLSTKVRAACDTLVAISGSGAIESLNVSVAASLLLSEILRTGARRGTRTPTPFGTGT